MSAVIDMKIHVIIASILKKLMNAKDLMFFVLPDSITNCSTYVYIIR